MHHVNLSVPDDSAQVVADWLVDVLKYRPVTPGPDAKQFPVTLWWFEADDGSQIHLTPNAEHRPNAPAHTAIRLDDALDATLARLRDDGQECMAIEFDGERHAFANDPAGNLWELIGPPAVG
jgi:catechol 2,3-dioxygenase-like lactoylglutathione lyase family enzyme